MLSMVTWFHRFPGFIVSRVSRFLGFAVSMVSRFYRFQGVNGFMVS